MVGFSAASGRSLVDILKIAVPIGVGIASAAYLGTKLVNSTEKGGFSKDKSIPFVALREGDQTHDAEYDENPDEFLQKCEQRYGSVFNLKIFNQNLTVLSGAVHIRELFGNQNDDLSFTDALDSLTAWYTFAASVRKSNNEPDNPNPHHVIKDAIAPHMAQYTPRIVERMRTTIDAHVGCCEGDKIIDNPAYVATQMTAAAMAAVYMGPELGQDPRVLQSFIMCTYDFGMMLALDSCRSLWSILTNRLNYGVINPLQRHVQILQSVAEIELEKRREAEADALRQGKDYTKPLDILQSMIDNASKYGYFDLEDLIGHQLILVLASVHTTTEAVSSLIYYLAAYPQYIEPLFEEVQEVLSEQASCQEDLRQAKFTAGDISSVIEFAGTELDPKHDRELTEKAIRKLVKLDSFIREIFRQVTVVFALYQVRRLFGAHMARKDVTLSNGMKITKGATAIANITSVHFNEQLQGENTAEFLPWRFVGKSKSASKASVDMLQFGMGRHACPGRFLAVHEIKIAGALLVTKYSKLEIQEKEKTKMMLLNTLDRTPPSAIIFTSRVANTIAL
ncbi:hypothetical protein BGX28_007921 [Mortierella sp. GBA30]|nr:hypothetical protein BGX28_007921 [Mortierella sp. GBA30]